MYGSPPPQGGNRHLLTVPPGVGGNRRPLGGDGHGGGKVLTCTLTQPLWQPQTLSPRPTDHLRVHIMGEILSTTSNAPSVTVTVTITLSATLYVSLSGSEPQLRMLEHLTSSFGSPCVSHTFPQTPCLSKGLQGLHMGLPHEGTWKGMSTNHQMHNIGVPAEVRPRPRPPPAMRLRWRSALPAATPHPLRP